jgi:hypothetical protein
MVPTPRRFPPQWTGEELNDACFIVTLKCDASHIPNADHKVSCVVCFRGEVAMSTTTQGFVGLRHRISDDYGGKIWICCAEADGHPLDEGEWDIKDNKYRVFIEGEWIVVPDDAVISGPNKFGKAIVWLRADAHIASGETHNITRIHCFIPGSGV